MKIAVITDTHFGARDTNMVFNEYFFKFWEKTFLPYIKKHKIKHIIHAGDIFDRRRYVNFNILYHLRTRFIEKLTEMGVTLHIIIGNHDTFYKNTSEVNGVQEVFANTKLDVRYYTRPEEIEFDGVKFLFVPWLNSNNMDESMKVVDDSDAKICVGHFEFSGFEMNRGVVVRKGIDTDRFKKFEQVWSGHFHHRSKQQNIQYLGSTYQITWADYNDDRGFHVYNTKNNKLVRVENPYKMFHKVYYDDKDKEIGDLVDNEVFKTFKGCYIKVIIGNKTNPYIYDVFMSELYKYNPHDVTVVEDMSNVIVNDGELIDEAEDTMTILRKYIDVMELTVDKDSLLDLMSSLYTEAIDMQ